MKMRIGFGTAAVLALLFGPSPVQADILFDDFSRPSPPWEYSYVSPTYSGILFVPPDSVNGGNLTRGSSVYFFHYLGEQSVSGQIGDGVFSQATSTGMSAGAEMTYQFAGLAGPLPFDVAPGGATGITLDFLSVTNPLPFGIQITDSTNHTASFNGVIPVAGNVTAPFSAFLGVDIHSVIRMKIGINGDYSAQGAQHVTGADFVLDSVILETPDPVPAPPAAFLALFAVPALGVRKWLRKA